MEALDSVRIESALAANAAREESDETGQADFLQMLVAQLQNQDPLNPQDSADFAAQLAQFSSVEQLIGVREGVDALVAQSRLGGDAGSAAGRVDPTGLIGREVVVLGGQVEVGAERDPVTVPFRTAAPAESLSVRVLDADGVEVHRESLVPQDASGRTARVVAGDHVYSFDPEAQALEPGIYTVELQARDADGTSVPAQAMASGVVTGAILAGEPSIRIGARVFSVEDVLEVRLPATEEAS
ncbi:MAG TPA: flagellar hook capping FlgD N-terminal domain-containing protein [Myxococcota bacterium]|nr:flagellar hook capping FlgD N-terminal domain-containing protein [Myxococcota bacterium]